MKTIQTPKGTTLPLVSLKGKDYLMVAYRIQWFNEEVSNFTIQTDFPVLTDEQTVARATVNVFDKDGKPIKSSTATKRETKKDFSDHTEKAETGAIGRAVTLLGFGTQFALTDLSEGDRIVDSPLVDVSKVEDKHEPVKEEKKSSFRKPKKEVVTQTEQSDKGWE